MKNNFTLIFISYFVLGITVCLGQTKVNFTQGGTIYSRVTFTSSVSNWTVPAHVSSINYLVVGGGGGGGGAFDSGGAGGGGGGQVKTGTLSVTGGSTINVIVGSAGAGGAADRNDATPEYNGVNGGDSSFDTIIANGGTGGIRSRGGGASAGGALNTGGSGGGGGNGGGGGGGNANPGSNGRTPVVQNGGNGGGGTSSNLSGIAKIYGTGGKGGTAVTGNNQPGNNQSATPANSGNGGNGAGVSGLSSLEGGAGSEGIVIITYIEVQPEYFTEGSVNYTRLTFTNTNSSFNWTVPSNVSSVNYLVVGGGGGGGGAFDSGAAGGGGGGQVKTGTLSVTSGSTINVTVGSAGAGGAADRNASPQEYNGVDGGNSYFDTIIANGGTGGIRSRGGGASAGGALNTGGSGGGGGNGGGGGGGNASPGNN
ncbi:glycine-rich domain-containing protein [Pedobacter xixiisoli]|uniref:Glycine-rich domain-containing protein n=1 Tax=Pedobacter xixiisoli TaxID=1476464 RepID=A0A286AAN5_9SPHI|nr:hypothetical protein [Pedobacter xixiisoli]SOD18976.1 hypothetical protein SAMN06297358_3283 [Pedobacter xixiisoli]